MDKCRERMDAQERSSRDLQLRRGFFAARCRSYTSNLEPRTLNRSCAIDKLFPTLSIHLHPCRRAPAVYAVHGCTSAAMAGCH